MCKKRLDKAERHKTPIYFIDECMFTVKTFLNTDWSPKRMNVTVKSSEFNTQSTAFLGAISEDKGLVLYRTYNRAVKTDNYIEFLQQLRKVHSKGRFILYMDSLSVHKCIKATKAYDDLDIESLYAPIYSPEYNPIEMMFAKLKALMKRLRLQDRVK